MFFIVGKSGCGKSTLLNIIGGIEKPTNGKVFINNINLNTMKSSEMDYYRGNLIGFIFQEYNLIGHLSVKENLKIANDIKGKIITEQDINNVLSKVGLLNFANHLPEEMSGGQQQRVAIARAILKEPQIILADEPTGNLDSATGKDIFNLLKDLSLTKLVIVVSHDIENAQQYGDGIVELKDGKIISNNIDNSIPSNRIMLKKKTSLKLNSLAKFSLHNIRKKPIMLIIAILLCITAIALGIYSQALADFNFYYSLSETLEQNGINLFSVNKSYGNYAEFSDEYFTTSEYNAIKENYSDNSIYKVANGNEYIIINGKSDIENMGLTLMDNSMEIDDKSIYVTDIFVKEKLEYASYYLYQNNVFLKITSIESFIGEIYGSRDVEDKSFNVAGIVITQYADKERFSGEARTKDEDINKFFNSNFNVVFCKEDYLRNEIKASEYKSIINIDSTAVSSQNTTVIQDYDYWGLGENTTLNFSSIMIYEDGSMWMNNIDGSNITLETNECIIPLTLYNEIFGTAYKSNDFVDIMDYNNIPKEIPVFGQRINIVITGEDKCVNLTDMKVVGVVFYPQLTGEEDLEINDIYFSENHVWEFMSYFNLKIYSIIGIINNYDEFSDFIKNTSNIFVDSAYSGALYKYEESIEYYKNTYLLISCVLIIMAIFLLYYHINNGIISEKKTIGILRSLGASQNDIVKIYLFQGLIISLFISFIVTSLILSLVPGVNILMAQKVINGAVLIKISPLMIIESIFSSFIAMLFAVLIPTIKLSRMKPIDVIRKI